MQLTHDEMGGAFAKWKLLTSGTQISLLASWQTYLPLFNVAKAARTRFRIVDVKKESPAFLVNLLWGGEER